MLSWEFPPRIVGGIARHCFGLAKGLVEMGHNVHIVTLDFPGSPLYENRNGINIHRVMIELGHPNFITWTFIFNHFLEKKIAHLSQDIKFDIIHIHDWLTAPAGIASKNYLNKPLISTVHSLEIGRVQELRSPDSYMIDGLEWWMTYESSKIILCSNSMRKELNDHFNLPKEKVTVIPNAIDPYVYDKYIDTKKIKNKYGIEDKSKLVLFVGRLVPQKGVEYLIDAVPLVTNNSVYFYIIGDGWSRSILEQLAFAKKQGDRIRFLGFIPDTERIELTKSADVLVVPSIYEPFGIVALEGMAAGVPVVASNIGGLSEIIEHDKTGVLVYSKNPESIAWGINKILYNNEYSRSIIQNAKKKVIEVYSWKAIAKKTIELYQESI
jgi:glycosyltransferase involved in cell wall biosynthesis